MRCSYSHMYRCISVQLHTSVIEQHIRSIWLEHECHKLYRYMHAHMCIPHDYASIDVQVLYSLCGSIHAYGGLLMRYTHMCSMYLYSLWWVPCTYVHGHVHVCLLQVVLHHCNIRFPCDFQDHPLITLYLSTTRCWSTSWHHAWAMTQTHACTPHM